MDKIISILKKFYFFEKNIPFSETDNDSLENIHNLGVKLIDDLNLNAKIKIIEGNVQDGIYLEHKFRLYWWDFAEEPFRYSLFKHWSIINYVEDIDKDLILTFAWQLAESEVNSNSWKNKLRDLSTDFTYSAFMQIFFRQSHQTLIRAYRWHSMLLNTHKSPYETLVKMYNLGVLPLGVYKDNLLLFKRSKTMEKLKFDSIYFNELYKSVNDKKSVFLSYEFKYRDNIDIIKNFYIDKGYTVYTDSVEDTIIPPENSLGKRILQSSYVLCLLRNYDVDYGLPIWMRQELEYATAKNIPVVLIAPHDLEIFNVNISYSKINCIDPFSGYIDDILFKLDELTL